MVAFRVMDTHPLSNIILTNPGKGKASADMQLLSLVISGITFMPSYVALKLLVPLILHLVACSAGISVGRHTDRQTNTTKYCHTA